MDLFNEKLELPQFIKHSGYRETEEGDTFQLFFTHPFYRKKKILMSYGNPINTVFEVWGSSLLDCIGKMKDQLTPNKQWDKCSKSNFIQQWGEEGLNWLNRDT